MVEHDGARAGRALIEREDVRHGRSLYNAPMQKGLLRELLAEFFGTFVLIVFGVGVVAQVVLSKQHGGRRICRSTSPGAWR